MTRSRRRLGVNALMWFGLFGAPTAWVLQHLGGLSLRVADCHDERVGAVFQASADTWTIVATATAAAIALLGWTAAIVSWRITRDADDDDPPPAGRVHFLGVIGLTVSPLFLAIILMSGIGSLVLGGCVQS